MSKINLTVKQLILGGLALVAVTLALVVGGYLILHKVQMSGKDQQQQVVANIGKLMLLPQGEDPSLATIQDVSKLKGQAVFSNAQNGDKVLVYTNAQKVIVYRPGVNKIVNVGPLVLDKQGSPYVTSKIAVLNGSGNTDNLNKMVSKIVAAYPNATIVEKDQAPRAFPNTIVVDATSKNATLNEQIAATIGGTAGQLPLGVNSAGADFVVIIGQDYK